MKKPREDLDRGFSSCHGESILVAGVGVTFFRERERERWCKKRNEKRPEELVCFHFTALFLISFSAAFC